MRVIPDENQPSAAIEIPLEKRLPDYDLEELEKPTPRDVDGILVTQGFRDLVDDARGILTELIAAPPPEHHVDKHVVEIACRATQVLAPGAHAAAYLHHCRGTC